MQIAIALVVTVVSSCALNLGYLIEHSVAEKAPPLTFRHPLRSGRALLGQRRWLMGFGIEVVGWLLYVLALMLAPLSLVQATAAGGVGILAVMASRYTGVPLTPLERLGVVLAVSGLALLGISLAGGHDEGGEGSYLAVGAWLGVSVVAAGAALRFGPRAMGGGPAFGLATGILFAAGDVATKTSVAGGAHVSFVPALILCYALGTAVLQAGFQRGKALTTAGIATLFTNALPIIAGMTIFDEPLPSGWLGAVRIVSFALVVTGAVALARHQKAAGAHESERNALVPGTA
jgi:drug/metabolite transporter (DMT)-like permease